MDLNRRSFIKLGGLIGISLITPGLSIADIIPKTGQKNIAQTKECKDFGEFLVNVANGKGISQDCLPYTSMPKRFTGILGRTAKKAGILGRLKREKLMMLSYASEALLEDKTALGDFTWRQLNEEISYQKPKRVERFSNNARELVVRVAFMYDESVFKFTVKAI